ncbi:MAG TPA: HPP family protein, partial [Verrucomicrobiae bacterium]
EPSVLTGHILTASRLGAAAVAIIVTLFMGNMLKASHPPAAATTLLVALGSLATMADAINVFIGAVLMAAIGKLIRTLRTKAATPLSQQFQPEITSRMAAKLDASAPR